MIFLAWLFVVLISGVLLLASDNGKLKKIAKMTFLGCFGIPLFFFVVIALFRRSKLGNDEENQITEESKPTPGKTSQSVAGYVLSWIVAIPICAGLLWMIAATEIFERQGEWVYAKLNNNLVIAFAIWGMLLSTGIVLCFHADRRVKRVGIALTCLVFVPPCFCLSWIALLLMGGGAWWPN